MPLTIFLSFLCVRLLRPSFAYIHVLLIHPVLNVLWSGQANMIQDYELLLLVSTPLGHCETRNTVQEGILLSTLVTLVSRGKSQINMHARGTSKVILESSASRLLGGRRASLPVYCTVF